MSSKTPNYVLADRAARRVDREACFFVPHVRADMRVLDCGCGPGSITLGLARHAGNVVGLDRRHEELKQARGEISRQRLSNVDVAQGDVFKLPFGDSVFDAVLLHAVLYHLPSPDKALKEIFRVLKPGGVVGVRDLDIEGNDYFQKGQDPLLDRALNICGEFTRMNGGNPCLGREHGTLLEGAGFSEIAFTSTWDSYEHGAAGADCGDISVCTEVEAPEKRREKIVEHELATPDQVDEMIRVVENWRKEPEAFFRRCRREAVAKKPSHPHLAA